MDKWRNAALGVGLFAMLSLMTLYRNFEVTRFDTRSRAESNSPKNAQWQLAGKLGEPITIHVNQSGRHKRLNRGIAHYTDAFYKELSELVERKADARDPQLIQFVRDILDPPSDSNMLKLSYPVKITPQSTEILKVLRNKRHGFFIECGGLDGERSSNTLYLEKEFGWRGLLVEMDPNFYTQLLGKSRQSWSLNACISPLGHVAQLTFKGSSGGMGRVEQRTPTDTSNPTVPCFPLETILLALNHTHVDYFSLDVEGAELSVLQTIPYDRIIVDTLSVEYRHGQTNAKRKILNFMQSKDYRVHKDIDFDDPAATLFVKDFIFVRNSLR